MEVFIVPMDAATKSFISEIRKKIGRSIGSIRTATMFRMACMIVISFSPGIASLLRPIVLDLWRMVRSGKCRLL